MWPLLVTKYGLENIFNCDETGMYDLDARGQRWSSGRKNTFLLKTYQVGLPERRKDLKTLIRP